jgi:hypothetical protein
MTVGRVKKSTASRAAAASSEVRRSLRLDAFTQVIGAPMASASLLARSGSLVQR